MTDITATISKFINEINYTNNEHVLGVFFYGSYLTGFNIKNSDIDLHIIFDNEDPNHLIRGNKIVDGIRIEYFEKTINEVYEVIENDYNNQSNAPLLIFGKTNIIYAKDDQIKKLQEYVISKFSLPMPPLSEDESKEQMSIINNRMEKLEKSALENSPYFDYLYHLIINKIRKFYHRLIGISKIPTSKVYRIYTDEDYRNSVYKENPDQEFLDMYKELITTKCINKLEKYQMVEEFYRYVTRNVNLGTEYRILIKSINERNK